MRAAISCSLINTVLTNLKDQSKEKQYQVVDPAPCECGVSMRCTKSNLNLFFTFFLKKSSQGRLQRKKETLKNVIIYTMMNSIFDLDTQRLIFNVHFESRIFICNIVSIIFTFLEIQLVNSALQSRKERKVINIPPTTNYKETNFDPNN